MILSQAKRIVILHAVKILKIELVSCSAELMRVLALSYTSCIECTHSKLCGISS